MNNVAIMTRPNIEIDDYESMMTLSMKMIVTPIVPLLPSEVTPYLPVDDILIDVSLQFTFTRVKKKRNRRK